MFKMIFGLSSFLWFGQALLSHNLAIRGNIAVTFHIEPNHNPKVGKTSQAWFLLTRPGGKIVPLSECECSLTLFLIQPKPINFGDLPLRAIAAERYKGIPGAEIIFKQTGLYQLKLEGKPKNGQEFQPFQVSYKVTVTR